MKEMFIRSFVLAVCSLVFFIGQCEADYTISNAQRAFGSNYSSGGWRMFWTRTNWSRCESSCSTNLSTYKAKKPLRVEFRNIGRIKTQFQVKVELSNGKQYRVPVINGFIPTVIIVGNTVVCDYQDAILYNSNYVGKVIKFKSTEDHEAYPTLKLVNTGEIKEQFKVAVELSSGRKVFIPIINGRIPLAYEWVRDDGSVKWITLDYSGGRAFTERDKDRLISYRIRDEGGTSDLPKEDLVERTAEQKLIPIPDLEEGQVSDLEEGQVSELPEEGGMEEGKTSDIFTNPTTAPKVEVEPEPTPEPTPEPEPEPTPEPESEPATEGGFSSLTDLVERVNEVEDTSPVKGSWDDVEDDELPISKSWPTYDNEEPPEKVKVRNSYLPNLD